MKTLMITGCLSLTAFAVMGAMVGRTADVPASVPEAARTLETAAPSFDAPPAPLDVASPEPEIEIELAALGVTPADAATAAVEPVVATPVDDGVLPPEIIEEIEAVQPLLLEILEQEQPRDGPYDGTVHGLTQTTVILLFVLACANAAVLVSILRRNRVRGSACGRCGYAVRGLESVRCPECGGHLPAVGIVTARMVPAVPTWLLALLAIVIVTVLLPLPFRLAMHVRDMVDPLRYTTTTSGVFRGEAGATLTIVHQRVQRGSTIERESFAVQPAAADGSGGGAMLGVTAADDPAEIARWLAANGLAGDTEAAARIVLLNVARLAAGDGWLATSPLSSVNGRSTATTMARNPLVSLVALAFVVVLWLGAIMLILAWARRRRRWLAIDGDRGT